MRKAEEPTKEAKAGASNGTATSMSPLRMEIAKLVPLDGLDYEEALTAAHVRLLKEGQRNGSGPGNRQWLHRLVEAERKKSIKARNQAKPKAAQREGVAPGFRVTDSEVQFWEQGKREGDPGEWITLSSKIEIVAMSRDGDSESWGRILQFTDDDGRQHEWALPMEMLSGDGSAYRARLLDQGVYIAPGGKAYNRFHEYICNSKPGPRARAAAALGWSAAVFIAHRDKVKPEEEGD